MPNKRGGGADKKAGGGGKKAEQSKQKKHHSKAKPVAKHGGGGGGGGKAPVKVAKDVDSKTKSFERHDHGNNVLPQIRKHEPKAKQESPDDVLGSTLAALEKEHLQERRRHAKDMKHQHLVAS